MTFTCSVEIDLPRDRVIALWRDPDNLAQWQDGFLGVQTLDGDPGHSGSRSILSYRIGKREIELTETIVSNDLPDWFIGNYESEAMDNSMINRFTVLSDARTRWDAEIEYTAIRGLVPKLMSIVMPGVFRKQTQKWLDQFRAFAEASTPGPQ